ncbi:MAG: RNA repair transcriptional activator RtcR [Kiritimatiellae bacterium]|nr:RNA repair transcriptional activator RtcR [Kiritimatiellia bacterium]
MKTSIISLLGSTLDAHGAHGKDRWNAWRPNVALAMQEDLHFDEFHLLYQSQFKSLADSVIRDIKTASPDTEVIPEIMEFDDPWDFGEVYGKLYDYALSRRFDREERDWYVHITTGSHVAQICLFLLNESHHLPGKLVQTSPSGRGPQRTSGPRGTYRVIDLELSRYDALARRFETERRDDITSLKGGIETRNAAFNALIETVERVAIRSRDPILLTGPTGAGKSQLARRVYELRKAKGLLQGAFVDVNCATLRGDQATSALFGHRKGAYTGAAADRPGLLKAADGGLLFLDEIGELGADEQAMLLRAIEEKRFLPLGSDKETESDFQLICGTNRDLGTDVAAGRFREDLLARIDLWSFRLPGLAERREDIEPNLDYELENWNARTGKRISFNKEARTRFLAWALDPATPWRGNFREFNACLTRLATLADGGRIAVGDVEAEIARAAAVPGGGRSGGAAKGSGNSGGSGSSGGSEGSGNSGSAGGGSADSLAGLLGEGYEDKFDRFDLAQLREVVEACRESRTAAEAGKRLFAVSRLAKKTANDSDRLAKYLAKFGLSFKAVATAGAD